MLKIDLSFQIDKEFIQVVMYKALTQGSTYWIEDVRHVKEDPMLTSFSTSFATGHDLAITNNYNHRTKHINLKDFKRGFTAYCKYRINNKLPICYTVEEIDIDIADEIMQFVVFKEIVFG